MVLSCLCLRGNCESAYSGTLVTHVLFLCIPPQSEWRQASYSCSCLSPLVLSSVAGHLCQTRPLRWRSRDAWMEQRKYAIWNRCSENRNNSFWNMEQVYSCTSHGYLNNASGKARVHQSIAPEIIFSYSFLLSLKPTDLRSSIERFKSSFPSSAASNRRPIVPVIFSLSNLATQHQSPSSRNNALFSHASTIASDSPFSDASCLSDTK